MRLMPVAIPRTTPDPGPALSVVVVGLPEADDGATLCVGRFDTPAGPVVAMGAGGTLWALGLAAELGEDAVRRDLHRRWPRATLVEAPEALIPAITALLAGRGEVRVRLAGSDFQTRVWRALLEIPPGEVTSYGEIAARIGQPGAARAVGSAVGQNPVAWLVPCHRVRRGTGQSGGYHWGLSVKQTLLAMERGSE